MKTFQSGIKQGAMTISLMTLGIITFSIVSQVATLSMTFFVMVIARLLNGVMLKAILLMSSF